MQEQKPRDIHGYSVPEVGLVLALLGDPKGDRLVVTLLTHDLEIESVVGDEWRYHVRIPILELLRAVMKDTKAKES